MSNKEFVPADWLAAGYRRFDENKDMYPERAFMVQKEIRDEETCQTRYFITVDVYDNQKYEGKIPTKWSFSPKVNFNRDINATVKLSTNDPLVAESEFHEIWLALGKPCY